jgi:hypothetical protein
MKRTALTSSFQLLAYADDIALIARRLPDLKEFFIRLKEAAKEAGLEVNEGKTNYLVVSRSPRRRVRNVRRLQLRACWFLQPSGKIYV